MDCIEYTFYIDRELYAELFRKHLSYKYHLHRSMYMSFGLYLFGLVMMYGFDMDFAFVNTIVFWVLLFAIVINLFADFYLSKKAFDNFKQREIFQGHLKIDSTGICITHEKLENKYLWHDFDSYVENDKAYMFYKGETFCVVPKQFDTSNSEFVNSILQNHFTKKGKRK